MPTYSYYIEDHDETPKDAIQFESVHSPDCGKWIAEDAAEEGHSNNDLWECRWPLTFVILNEDGTELGKYLVERESKPDFCATQKQA